MAHTLYYSSHCSFCSEVLDTVVRKGVQSLFGAVCVDGAARNSLPSVVDRVPLIITQHGNVVVDEDVVLFVEMLHPPQSNAPQGGAQAPAQAQAQQKPDGGHMAAVAPDTGDIAPLYAESGMVFSVLDGEQGPNCHEHDFMASYTYTLGGGALPAAGGQIESFTNMETQKKGKGDGSASALERLVAERDNDVAMFRPQRPV